MTDRPAEGTEDDKKSEAPPPSPDPTAGFVEAIGKVRSRSDLTAKALGALGTTAVGWAGIETFADVFPLPDGPWPELGFALAGVVVGLIGLGVAVFGFTYRLWRVQQPIFTSSVPTRMELNDKERRIIERVYARMAALNDAPSLRAYEARGHRYERIAETLDVESDKAKKLKERAQTVRDEVRATHLRAASEVVRFRSSQAIRGGGAWVLYLLFLVSLFGFGLGSDYLKAERDSDKDRIAEVKSCADAVKAIRDAEEERLVEELPDACGEPSEEADADAEDEEESSATVEGEVAAAIKALGVRYTACVAALEEPAQAGRAARCERIRLALNRLSE